MISQKPIYVFAIWKVKEGHIETVLHALKTVCEKSVKESGNLFYKIHQNNSDVNTIVLFEGYTDESAVTYHKNTAHYKDLVIDKIIPLLETREIILTTLIEGQ